MCVCVCVCVCVCACVRVCLHVCAISVKVGDDAVEEVEHFEAVILGQTVCNRRVGVGDEKIFECAAVGP